MIHLELPFNRTRPLTFYLAMEEWAATALPPADYFFAWRVGPTVICGRNQDIASEVDLEYCRRNGIDVVRRRSGGGAVYADMHNWMFSLVTPGDDIQKIFSHYTATVADMLCNLGINACADGRNDITVGGRKISGNAFYHLRGRNIVHGTMLYSYVPERLARTLTPSPAKLQAKGVRSVPSRVTSLSEHGIVLGLEEFGEYAVNHLCNEKRSITRTEIAEIETIAAKYREPEWFCGRRRRPGTSTTSRIDGAGVITATYTLEPEGNTFTEIDLKGDFFGSADSLCSPLKGVARNRNDIIDALAGTDVGAAIHGLDAESLAALLTTDNS